MIRFRVDALTGHYGSPGSVSSMAHHVTKPFAPPSTVKGFIESMCGKPRDTLDGEYAYAYLGCEGRGSKLRTSHVWLSGAPGLSYAENKKYRNEHQRPTHVDFLYRPSYVVCVRGECADLVRRAYKQGVPRTGVLSLGTSDDGVIDVRDVGEEEVPWIVKGKTYLLTTRTTDTELFEMKGTWERFSLEKALNVPEGAWFPL